MSCSPPQVTTYNKAIKVTVDGPREPRSKTRKYNNTLKGRTTRLGHMHFIRMYLLVCYQMLFQRINIYALAIHFGSFIYKSYSVFIVWKSKSLRTTVVCLIM